jgi:alpha-ketoglutarate-dependent taurine dioxygenase
MKAVFGDHPAARILKVHIDPKGGVEAASEALGDALIKSHVIHLTGGGADDSLLTFWADVGGRIARIDERGEDPLTLKRRFAVWNDIRFDPALATTYRHSNTAQPLHTDGAFHATPPDIGFFFCQVQAKAGGRTLFVDGKYLCGVLERESPELYSDLRSIPVSYGKGDAPGQTGPIIGWDRMGPVINWNYYRISPGQGPAVLKLRQAFFDYLDKRFMQTGDMAPLHLAAGDCMIFHDLRVLHGREAFSAKQAGERCLWHMSLHWDSQLGSGASH